MRAGAGAAARALAPLALLCLPGEAFAHASDRGHVLLLPTGHYVAGGALAVAASFLALAVLPPPSGRAPAGIALGTVSPRWLAPGSLVGLALLAVLLAAGFWGSRDPLSNPLPLTVWTLLWVGLTLACGLIGNLWAVFEPWRLLATGKEAGKASRLGLWPAVVLFAGFAWFELIDPAPDDPARLAVAVGAYVLLGAAATLFLGHRFWTRQADFLSVFFAMVGRFGVVDAEGGRLRLVAPGARLATAPALPPSGAAFLLLALASVSFDGLSKTFFWLGANGVNPLEFPGRTAMMATNTVGLAGAALALGAVFVLAVWAGERLAGRRGRLAGAAGLLVWSLVPIALAYHFAHYLTALLVNGQYALVALSDPFARGWNLFGTAHRGVGAGIAMGSAAAWVVWNLQAAAIVGGHVLAVLAAHRLAARLHANPRAATLSQIPLTALMVGYTVFGLWLLSTPTGV